ncbi:MAG: secretin N-terminal domain-containing protein [Acidobacteriota bacterium]
MAKTLRLHQTIALALALTLAAPIAAFAADGKKHFNEGIKYEQNRQWDKAAQEFALAVSEKPSNIEYQLHLQRALVSAGTMLVERGDSLAEKKDYNAAYNAYRQAFSFDPTNELALIKMRRMLEAQGLPPDNLPTSGDPAGPKYRPDSNLKASYTSGGNAATLSPMRVQMPAIPGRRFSRTDVVYRDTNILTAIEQLAQMMKLNVMFDQMVVNQMKMIKISVELRDVTYPRALEMILKTNNLMYAQIDTRTIVIASDNPQQRTKYEPYAVRTFYIKNATVDEMRGAITGALATKNIVPVKQLNALIVRDTPANLELVENLINSIDKSKAEVLIDVNIYEVSHNDLLQIGNQFGVDPSTIGARKITIPAHDITKPNGKVKSVPEEIINVPGGVGAGAKSLGGFGLAGAIAGNVGSRVLTGPLGLALGLPSSTISFFQDRGKAKLLASTQVHVLDNEQNTVRIGQRVPIQTASLPSYNTPTVSQPTTGTGGTNNQTGNVNQNSFLGGAFGVGIPQIQYENVGLNIDITPNVYEDDVQMKMKIESTSIDGSTSSLTPTFSQRQMSSVARVRDGQTTLVAGVSQSVESKNVRGIPFIGLIPILGRFFATPDTRSTQSDVIITVTPHILRRADITEKDHYARAAGDVNSSSNQLKIEQILYLADQEDAQPNQVAENPAPAAPETKPQPVSAPPPPVVNTRSDSPGVVVAPPPAQALRPNVIKMQVSKPGIQTGNSGTGAGSQQVNPANKAVNDDDDDDDEPASTQAQSAAPLTVYVRPNSATATKGQDLYVAIFVNGNGEVSSAHITLGYDASLLEVKGVRDSGMLGAGSRAELQFSSDGGVLSIQMDRLQGTGGVPARGQLCLVVFGVKAPGQSPLLLNEAQTQFRSSTGQALPIKVQSSQVEIR